MTNPLVGHVLGSYGHMLLGHMVCHVLGHVTGLGLGHVTSHVLGHMMGVSQGHMLEDSLWLLVVDQALSWAQEGVG